jgi:hypothetical protein
MAFLWTLLIKMLVLLFVTVVVGFFLRRMLKGWEKRAAEQPVIARCSCGYPLEGLALARCPECGRVIGFNATAEELGLDEQQLKRVIETRNRRAAEDNSS